MRALLLLGDPHWSGHARTVITLGRCLAARGHLVTIAAIPGAAAERARGAGLTVRELVPGTRAGGMRRSLRDMISQSLADAVFVTDEMAFLVAAQAARSAHRSVIVRRTSVGERLEPSARERRAARLAPGAGVGYLYGDRVEAQRAALPKRGLPCGLCEPMIEMARIPDVSPDAQGHVLVLCDGRNNRRVHTFLRAAALVARRHAELRLLLAGPGAIDDDLRVHAASLGIAARVGVGSLDADDAWGLAGAMMGCVLSDGDDGAYAALDLMARRMPVLGEKGPSLARIVADGITGELYEPGEPAAAAAALAELLGDVARRNTMGNAGRLRVAREFAPEAALVAFEQAVARADGARPARSAAG